MTDHCKLAKLQVHKKSAIWHWDYESVDSEEDQKSYETECKHKTESLWSSLPVERSMGQKCAVVSCCWRCTFLRFSSKSD